MTPSERLQAARVATDEGRYEHALTEFLWFHEHALEVEPSLGGVRLSFALAYWSKLGAVYPKALQELERLRDRAAGALLDGTGGFSVFHDLAAINRTLSLESHTYDVFVQLASSRPDLATACASVALPCVVWAGDYALAARFAPEPETQVRVLTHRLNADVLRRSESPRTQEALLRAFSDNFAAKVKLLSDLQVGLGQAAEAARLELIALQGIESQHVRQLVQKALAGDERTT